MTIDLKAIRDVASVTSDDERMQFKPSSVIALLDRLEAAEKDAAHLFSTTSGTFIREQIDAAMKEQK